MEADAAVSRYFLSFSFTPTFGLSQSLSASRFFCRTQCSCIILCTYLIPPSPDIHLVETSTITGTQTPKHSLMAAPTGSMFSSSARTFSRNWSVEVPSGSNSPVNSFLGASVRRNPGKKARGVRIIRRVRAAAAGVSTSPIEEIKDYELPSWAKFELGIAPVYWKTMNGLPPTSGGKLKLFYNPAATKLTPNEEFGIGFNGGFNQPIMCGGEPRAMLRKDRGKADSPIYTIQICIPNHALNLIFSFTNGVDWDGPYRLRFQVPRAWRNMPIQFFNEGLAEELGRDGACDRAIFPDTNMVITRCAMIGNLSIEGGDRCDLNLVLGCMDPSSPLYDPLADVDDGSCPPYSDSESED